MWPSARRASAAELQLGVEVAAVGEDRAVAHDPEVLLAEDVEVAGGGDEDLAPARGVGRGHDLVAVHERLDGADGIDLDDRDPGAHAIEADGDAAADPAVAGHDAAATREQDVGRAQDAVEGGLARAVAVVEQVLRQRLVDGHDGERERAVGRHGPEADDARWSSPRCRRGRRAALVAALLVEQRHEVAAVVHRDVRVRVGDGVEMRVVRVALSSPRTRERADAVAGDERRRDVVLGRERVRRAERDLGAAGLRASA